jgi:hypothetical protein
VLGIRLPAERRHPNPNPRYRENGLANPEGLREGAHHQLKLAAVLQQAWRRRDGVASNLIHPRSPEVHPLACDEAKPFVRLHAAVRAKSAERVHTALLVAGQWLAGCVCTVPVCVHSAQSGAWW